MDHGSLPHTLPGVLGNAKEKSSRNVGDWSHGAVKESPRPGRTLVELSAPTAAVAFTDFWALLPADTHLLRDTLQLL